MKYYKWTPLKLCLPFRYRLVLVKFEGGKSWPGPMCVAYRNSHGDFITPGQRSREEIGDITHWLDCLPEGFNYGALQNDNIKPRNSDKHHSWAWNEASNG